MSENIVEISEVKQAFRIGFLMKKLEVLHGFSFAVPRRSIFGFLGANGAGKTTLIHLMTGLRKPTAGTVTVAGYPAASKEARARIGYLPERPYFHEHLSGERVLRYFGTLAGMSNADIDARIPRVLEQVGMSHARKLELRRYSKGMLQRIGIAQALLHNPEFLVLDEPMSGLDPLGRKEIRELIVQLASEGRTIFFSSHVIPDVEAICDRVALIQKGNLIGCGPISQFLAQGTPRTEIAFTQLGIEAAKEISSFQSLRQIPDGVRGVVSGHDAVHAALRRLLELKAQILWVTPIRPSLENLFSSAEEPAHE